MLGDAGDDRRAAGARRPVELAAPRAPSRKLDGRARPPRRSAASASQRSPVDRASASEPSTPEAGAAVGRRGISASASSAARRTCGSGSSSSPRARIVADGRRRPRQRPATALRRTPADGCFSAADRRRRPSGSTPSPAAQARAASRGHGSPPAFRPIASTDVSATSFDQVGDHVRLAALDQQPLGVQPPEHVVVLQRRDEPLRRRPSSSFGGSLGLPSFVDDAVDAAVRLVAQRGLVGGPLAGLEALRASGCAGR